MKKDLILLVDDDPDIRALLRRHLRVLPAAETAEAADGPTAVRLARERVPELILMDLSLPGMDGIEAIRTIRSDPRLAVTPIVFLSAESDRDRWVEAFEAGASDFVAKPYERRELLARIGTHLRLASLTRELARKNALMEYDRQLARNVQKQLLPRAMEFPGVEAASLYRACEQIGGDFFEAWEQGGAVNFVVGDISGHGASSALIMAVCKGILSSQVQARENPLEVILETNRMLWKILEGGDLDMFVTLVFASIDRERDVVRVISAGHPPVFLLSGGAVSEVPSNGPAMGWHEYYCGEVTELPFAPGDTLFFFTDGLVDVRDEAGEFFGEERLKTLLVESEAPAQLVERIWRAASSFCNRRIVDDVTVLAVRRQ